MSNVRPHVSLAPLHEALVSELAARLPDWRFTRAVRSFRRHNGACTWSLHLAFVNHDADFDIVADVAVEHTANKQRICIVGAELGNISGTGQRRWSVHEQSDVQVAAAGVLQLFAEVGMPFLERYTSLHEILRVLRTEPRVAQLICPLAKDPEAEASAIEARVKQNAA